MYKYRVLLQDKEKGFQFAIKVDLTEGVKLVKLETLSELGIDLKTAAEWLSETFALREFPDATFVKTEFIEPPSYGYEPCGWTH